MIPFFDPRPSHERHRQAINGAVLRVLGSKTLLFGQELTQFESEFAQNVGVSNAIGVHSGTDALQLALTSLDLGPDAEVITTAHTAVATVAAIRLAGALPKFLDIDPRTCLLDLNRLEEAITPNTRAIVPVHLYGQAVPMDELLQIARRHRLAVVEDCAQAFGARWKGTPVGTFGDVGCFSFYPTKNLGALGDGGACVTNDTVLAESIRSRRQYGLDATRHARCEGINSRLDELQAAVLRVKLRAFPEALSQRERRAKHYRDALAGGPWDLPLETEFAQHAYHLFVLRCHDRSRVIEALDSAGIGWAIHYPVPIHLMDAYRSFGDGPGSLPETERAANDVLSLPLYDAMPDEHLKRIIEILRSLA
ncbi:dTDP-3-amino-3,6-dideoxy-alpha-D-galactopyranose transaminase [Planctomycetes bacterium Pan216]|uniref:dTDP-3-amino-3,6-dideoxy-alpha-D-galactopyranose transaminase n=1 Tax=Kolteria novifilia TaxID=2527975 RepID=A0A518B950_9BACT|nr:dTDP-3-amino-3,6-dideoxy-alpha-D-galactopyranose transaminase [Planctomycetes bacterium Pan216]